MELGTFLSNIPTIIVGFYVLKLLWEYYTAYRQEKLLNEAFKNTPKDKVILHLFPKVPYPSKISSPQPWVFKLELYFKLAKIPYERDYTIPFFGPASRSPWITLNGKHQYDSQMILESLRKKFNVDLNKHYTESEIAVARSVRVMMEERFFWCMPLWRFVWPEGYDNFMAEFGAHKRPFYYPASLFRWNWDTYFKKQSWAHGIGRLTKEQAIEAFKGDLKTVSDILGDKQYILGDELCEEDCAIFGMLTQPIFGMPGAPYEKYVEDELPNLKAYCGRIRAKYFNEEWE